MQLAWPDQALHNGNVYGVLPASAAKNISIYLMLVHQVRLWVMHRGSAAPTAEQDWCSLGIGMQLVSQLHPFMSLGRCSQSVLHHTQRSNYLLCIANNLEPDTVPSTAAHGVQCWTAAHAADNRFLSVLRATVLHV